MATVAKEAPGTTHTTARAGPEARLGGASSAPGLRAADAPSGAVLVPSFHAPPPVPPIRGFVRARGGHYAPAPRIRRSARSVKHRGPRWAGTPGGRAPATKKEEAIG